MSLRAIVLVVIDCLRADHVTSYGYDRPTTPTIDSLARHGTLWEQAFSTSSWTKPSVASLLTGLSPSRHGALRGIKRSKGESGATTDVLQSSGRTLAEAFSDAGWRCGAFINNAQLGEFTRLDRGFGTYKPTAGKADHLLSLLETWLREDTHQPTFSYLHFLEAHWPYKPRRRHVALFGGNRDTNCFGEYSARDYGRFRRAIKNGERTVAADELEQMMQMYDGSVRRLDGKITILLDILNRLGLRDDVALFITADHGEEFMDHGDLGHGHTLYDEVIHVPLVACVPGRRGGNRRSEPVSLVDLPYTLLRLAGIAHDLPGKDLFTEPTEEAAAWSELSIRRRYTQTIRTRNWKLHRRYKFEPEDADRRTGLPRREWIEQCPHRVTYELYDIRRDRREQVNLAGSEDHQEERERLSGRLDQWWEAGELSVEDAGTGEVEIDERVVSRLRDLGYLE